MLWSFPLGSVGLWFQPTLRRHCRAKLFRTRSTTFPESLIPSPASSASERVRRERVSLGGVSILNVLAHGRTHRAREPLSARPFSRDSPPTKRRRRTARTYRAAAQIRCAIRGMASKRSATESPGGRAPSSSAMTYCSGCIGKSWQWRRCSAQAWLWRQSSGRRGMHSAESVVIRPVTTCQHLPSSRHARLWRQWPSLLVTQREPDSTSCLSAQRPKRAHSSLSAQSALVRR